MHKTAIASKSWQLRLCETVGCNGWADPLFLNWMA